MSPTAVQHGPEPGLILRPTVDLEDADFVVVETDDPNAVPDPGRALLTWMPDLGVTRIRARGVDPDGLFSVAELAGRFHPIDFVVIPHAGAAWAMLMYVPAGLAVDGGAADELLVGSHYADTLAGAAGDDLLVGNAGDDWIEGGAGSDDLRGGAGDDTLFGGSSQAPGADAMDAFHFAQAGNGEDEIRDFSFSDRIVVRSGVQVADVQVVGANGSTTLFLDTDGLAGAEVVIRLAGRFDPTVFSVAFADGFTVLTHGVFTGDGPDTVVLTDAAEGVHALGGDDSVQALAGNDTVYGGVGDDTVDGGAGHDQLDGGAGNDWLVFAGATEAVTVDLLAGTVARDGLGGSDTAVGFEHVRGTAFDDLLAAGPQASHLVGGAGNDTLVGSGGADTLEGGDGVDTLVVDGRVVAPRRIDLATGQLGTVGRLGQVSGIENVTGTSGTALWVVGSLGANVLRGGSGQDTLVGQATAADGRYVGSATGGDRVAGGGGSDTVQGGAGDDTLWGGSEGQGDPWLLSDVFAFADRGNGRDLIADFGRSDSIRVANGFAEWAPLKVTSGDGTTVSGGSVQFRQQAGFATLYLDTDGVTGAEVVIDLAGTFDILGFNGYRGQGTTAVFWEPRTGSWHDHVTLTAADDYLHGFEGNDSLQGEGGADSLFGDSGDDTLTGGAGDDVLDGGTHDHGGDWLAFGGATSGVAVDLAAGQVTADGLGGQDTITGFENVRDTWYSDTLVGDAADNTFSLMSGTFVVTLLPPAVDVVDGRGGFDWIVLDPLPAFADLRLGHVVQGRNTARVANVEAVRIPTGSSWIALADGGGAAEAGNGFSRYIGGGGSDSFRPAGAFNTLTGGGGADVFHIGPSLFADLVTDFGSDDILRMAALPQPVSASARPNGVSTLLKLQWKTESREVVLAGVYDPAGFVLAAPNADGTVDIRYTGAAPKMGLAGVAIAGSFAQHQQLWAQASFGELGTPPDLAYQWYVNGSAIAGATQAMLVLTQDHVGQVITVGARARESGATVQSVVAPGGVVADVNDAPGGSVAMVGRMEPGWFVSVADAITDLDGAGARTYQWLLDGEVIAGATGSALRLTAAMAGHSVAVRGSYVDGGGTPETITSVAAVVGSAPADGLRGIAYHWRTHQLLEGVQLQVAGGPSAATDAAGSFAVQGLSAAPVGLLATRGAADAAGAITSADALAALRIALGIHPNADPDGAGPLTAPRLSPYQVIAADMNGDGKVTSADALAILRMAVKAPNAPAPTWAFVDEKLDLWDEGAGSSALQRSAARWNQALEAAAGADSRLHLVGVLRGDVNGSWSSAGAQDLDSVDPKYFELLGAQLQQPLDVWGG